MDITIKIDGKITTAKKGVLLSELLLSHAQSVEMPCGCRGKCGKCRIFASGMLSEPTEAERGFLGDEALNCGIRLACLTRAEGDCTIVTIGNGKSKVLIEGEMPEIQLNTAFKKYGVAIDIGTTTLASRLFDANGRLIGEAVGTNPQSAFGADVLTRMEAAANGNSRKLAELTISAIDSLITELTESAGIDTQDIDEAVIVGNTAMLHLLTETDVTPLIRAPFEAKRLFNEVITADKLRFSSLKPEAEVYFPACISAFIGADTTAAILASGLWGSDVKTLLCDIGTNGEMVLFSEGKQYACSTAAGPAFEGAGISMGMSGRVGAIDHVSIERGILVPHVIGGVEPIGICGSGIIDAIACLLELELLDETGRLFDERVYLSHGVFLTQEDIRKLQLAKGAIHAGIRALLHASSTDASELDELIIAGGFGSYLDVESAIRIGLLPSELSGKIRVIGNAALTGATMLLLDRSMRELLSRSSRSVEVTELLGNPVFSNEFMERMMFE